MEAHGIGLKDDQPVFEQKSADTGNFECHAPLDLNVAGPFHNDDDMIAFILHTADFVLV